MGWSNELYSPLSSLCQVEQKALQAAEFFMPPGINRYAICKVVYARWNKQLDGCIRLYAMWNKELCSLHQALSQQSLKNF